jgi:hypothetical protein
VGKGGDGPGQGLGAGRGAGGGRAAGRPHARAHARTHAHTPHAHARAPESCPLTLSASCKPAQKICRLLEIASSTANALSFLDAGREEEVLEWCGEFFETLRSVQDDLVRLVEQCPAPRSYGTNTYAEHARLWISAEQVEVLSQQIHETAAAARASAAAAAATAAAAE